MTHYECGALGLFTGVVCSREPYHPWPHRWVGEHSGQLVTVQWSPTAAAPDSPAALEHELPVPAVPGASPGS